MTKQFAVFIGLDERLDFKGVLLVQLTIEGRADDVAAASLEQVTLARTTFAGRVISETKKGYLSFFVWVNAMNL